jgi:hypothetical protein
LSCKHGRAPVLNSSKETSDAGSLRENVVCVTHKPR